MNSGFPEYPEKVLGIIGLGNLGASIAESVTRRQMVNLADLGNPKAWPSKGFNWRVVGVSSPVTIQKAKALNIISEGYNREDARHVLSQCDLVFLCMPIDQIIVMLKEWAKHPPMLKPGAVISDVGSTKREICALGKLAIPNNSGGIFIGSHPMAGSEKTGLDARDPYLFEKATWIVCPEEGTTSESVTTLSDFIRFLGAHTIDFPPDIHDWVVAYASHLPQLLSTALAAFVYHKGEYVSNIIQVAGNGFRDMTRLAASTHKMWEPILRTNRELLLKILPDFRKELENLEQAIVQDGGRQIFEEANTLRGRANIPRKGFSSNPTEILVELRDNPGSLLRILEPIAQAKINIRDIEILKVREDVAGALMMGFEKLEEAEAVLRLLTELGHKARLR